MLRTDVTRTPVVKCRGLVSCWAILVEDLSEMNLLGMWLDCFTRSNITCFGMIILQISHDLHPHMNPQYKHMIKVPYHLQGVSQDAQLLASYEYTNTLNHFYLILTAIGASKKRLQNLYGTYLGPLAKKVMFIAKTNIGLQGVLQSAD